jgi:flagella basal body P-ring formation protein FlgA
MNPVAELKPIESPPDLIVVPRRPLRRGEIIQAADLDQQPLHPGAPLAAAVMTELADVVGRETTRSIATGQAIDPSWIRKPLMVRRGDVVTVLARSGNVQVRTSARAIGDGGEGDVVTVERLDNRQRYTARVVGVQELEVFASSASVAGPAAPLPPRIQVRKAASPAKVTIQERIGS